MLSNDRNSQILMHKTSKSLSQSQRTPKISSSLLGIPIEIRHHIFQQLLPSSHIIELIHLSPNNTRIKAQQYFTGVSKASRQLRQEAIAWCTNINSDLKLTHSDVLGPYIPHKTIFTPHVDTTTVPRQCICDYACRKSYFHPLCPISYLIDLVIVATQRPLEFSKITRLRLRLFFPSQSQIMRNEIQTADNLKSTS